MNEQMQNALVELINKANQGIDASTDFLTAQMPDVIHQLLMWYAVKGVILFSFSVLLLVAGICLQIWAVKRAMSNQLHEFSVIMCTMLGWAIAGPTILITFNLDWLQIWIAPKIWLIEYAASLAK